MEVMWGRGEERRRRDGGNEKEREKNRKMD